MNKWILSACCLALAATPVAAADVRLDSYRNPASESFRNFNRLYLDGARAGLISYNLLIKRRGGQPLFCLPDLGMTTEQTEEIMLKAADKRAAKGDMLIAPLLLLGLQDTYPCEKAGGQ